MKALKVIGLFLLALVVLILILGLLLPKDYEIRRETDIAAPRPLVFRLVGSLRAMEAWSPWAGRDPEQETIWEGEDGAVGSEMRWSGNEEVGKGRQILTFTEAPRRVEIHLVFETPFASEMDTWVELEESEQGTRVIWAMSGRMPFPWNVLGPLFNMEEAIGGDYEKGLASLKALAEAQVANPVYRGFAIQKERLEERYYAAYRAQLPFEEMDAYFRQNMPAIFQAVQRAKAEIAGPPTGLYYDWDMEASRADMATAMPLRQPLSIRGASLETLPAGEALVIDYYGPYAGTGEAHFAMDDYLSDFGLRTGLPVLEEYITDPATEPDTTRWHTRIIYRLEPASSN